MAAVITLTTDYGTRDPYVAEMKAVILGLNPEVRLIDVTHDVRAHDVIEGGLAVEAVSALCPGGTVHVVVVDPGVGTRRRGLVVAASGQLFVGPDNGLFTPVLSSPGWQAFELRASRYRRAQVSPTFHGRDIFAPAAAHLTLGVSARSFGPPVTDPVRGAWPSTRPVTGGVEGEVIHVDRFGNLVTSIDADTVDRVVRAGGRVVVSIGRHRLSLVHTYGELTERGPGALVGSRSRLEIAVREASAATRLGAGRGAKVRLSCSTMTKRTTSRRGRS